jgi:hypothetical protein
MTSCFIPSLKNQHNQSFHPSNRVAAKEEVLERDAENSCEAPTKYRNVSRQCAVPYTKPTSALRRHFYKSH